ncbi:MAG: transcriptional regulator [Actinomycetota bacterium]|nr:transcriptional regulator [Actinomycetota bacterium]
MTDDTHPIQALDDLVHQKSRLGILAVLAEADHVTFTYLKKTLHLTDGNLGRHLEVLENAGYIETDKRFIGRRPQTTMKATPAGRDAYEAELDVLRALVQRTADRRDS